MCYGSWHEICTAIRMRLSSTDERMYIYGTVLVLCAVLMPLVGFAASAWSWLQIIVVVELIQWQARLAVRSLKPDNPDL